MNNDILIRLISIFDTESVTALTNQLGSNVQEELVKAQIEEIIENKDHFAFVAILNDQVVGYIHCFNAIRLTQKPFTEICGLVVDINVRNMGIGSMLVEKVENLFDGNRKIRVRCNSKRELAHNFYTNQNYSLSKDQKIFEKEIIS